MIEQLENLIRKAKSVSDELLATSGKIRIISHYDADGITSAAIMVKALIREGRDFHLSLVKQLNEDIVENLAKEKGSVLLFLDLGSGQLTQIYKHLLSRDKTVFIADHHQIQGEAPGKRIFHLNPNNFGITENVSGSGISYLLARAIGVQNKDLSELAIVGAIGDSQMGSIGPDWGLSGLNKEILKDAASSGKIRIKKGLRIWGRYSRPIHKALEYSMDPYIPGISGSESAAVQFLQEIGIEVKKGEEWRTLADLSEEEQKKLAGAIIAERIRDNHENPDWIFGDVYELTDKPGQLRDANEFATVLNATGKMKMEHLGVSLCLNVAGTEEEVKDVLASYRREIGKALDWVKKNKKTVRKTDCAHYLDAGDSISEHIISNVTSIVNRSDLIPDKVQKPIFAFVNTEDGKVKVSARASDDVVKGGLNLKELVSFAAIKLKGEGGGHAGAAGATIPGGSTEEFMGIVEEKLGCGEEKTSKAAEKTNINPKPNKSDTGEKDVRDKEREGAKGKVPVGKVDKKVEGKGLVRYFGS